MIGQNSKYAMVSKWSSWNTALVILSLFFLYIVHREGQDWPHSPPDSSQPIYQGGTSCHGPFSLLHQILSSPHTVSSILLFSINVVFFGIFYGCLGGTSCYRPFTQSTPLDSLISTHSFQHLAIQYQCSVYCIQQGCQAVPAVTGLLVCSNRFFHLHTQFPASCSLVLMQCSLVFITVARLLPAVMGLLVYSTQGWEFNHQFFNPIV